LLYLWVFCTSVVQASFNTLLSPYLGSVVDLSDAAIGIVASSVAVVALISRLPIGSWYRPYRALLMLASGMLVSGLAVAAFGFTKDRAAVMLIAVVWGFGWSLATTIQLALVVHWKPERMTRVSAVSWYAALASIGHASSGFSGFVADHLGFQIAYLSLGGLLLVNVVSQIVLMVFQGRRPALAEDGLIETPSGGGFRSIVRLRGLTTVVWVGVLLGFQMNVVTGMVKTFQPVLALAAGLTLTQISILHGLTGVGSGAIRIGSGLAFRRRNMNADRLNTPLVVAGIAAAAIVPAVKGSFALQVPLFLTLGLSRGLLRATSTVSAFEPTTTSAEHGRIAAVLHGGLDLGGVVGPALSGLLAQAIGLDAVFVVIPLVLFLAYRLLEHAARRGGNEPVPG
jgi:predicted MFS family arabinose efflux permease